jgi:hypothetical protein
MNYFWRPCFWKVLYKISTKIAPAGFWLWDEIAAIWHRYTDKKYNKISSYSRKFRWDRCKVIYEEGFLINEEMRKYLDIYVEGVSHKRLCNCFRLDFLIDAEFFLLLFYQCTIAKKNRILPELTDRVSIFVDSQLARAHAKNIHFKFNFPIWKRRTFSPYHVESTYNSHFSIQPT